MSEAAEQPTKANPMLLRRVVETLPRYAYRFSDEVALQDGIAQVLQQHAITFVREHVAGPEDRFDFLLSDGIVIEAKIKGSMPQALRQVSRYAARPEVSAVVLVSSRQWRAQGRMELHDKPVHIVYLRGASF